MNDGQLKLFELWAKSVGWSLEPNRFNTDYRYASETTNRAFEAWQAACDANGVGEPCKCGFKRLAADKMAAVLDDWVYRDIIDPRSSAADARLSYGEPSPREEVNRILGRPLDAPFERSVIGEPSEVEGLRSLLRDVSDAMKRYEMDVDDEPPFSHRALMERVTAALAKREERA